MKKKRSRATNAQIAQLEKQIHEILLGGPETIRHVFYRLTDPRWEYSIPKTEDAYNNLVSRLTIMRKAARARPLW